MLRRSLLVLPLLVAARPALADVSPNPLITQMSPASGQTDVDPATTLLSIYFDRPMRASWSFVKSDQGEWPNIGLPTFQHGDILFADLRLAPSTTYAFSLNSTRHTNFRSSKGIPLPPTLVRFRTGALKGA